VASCAYHLSILGKYGYARQVPGHAGSGAEHDWLSLAARRPTGR